MKAHVILVDEKDREKGVMEKLEAHQKGLLHRAFSVLIYNDKGEWLLQKRASAKYHSAGLWTNACCSHPEANQSIKLQAEERLKFEMGIHTDLQHRFNFIYKAELDNGLTEHEFDHVFIGTFSGNPILNPDEAEDFIWKNYAEILQEINTQPEKFTEWFKLIVHHPKIKSLI